jgi:acyl-CoA reductase-like NAD-dependent aldehyde dehydrogenase
MPGATNGTNGTHALNGDHAFDFTAFKHCINGEFPDTKIHRQGINPANLKAPMPEVPVATKEDLDKAVGAARAAYKKWSKVPFEDRKKAVMEYADAMDEVKDEFIHLLTTEQGKPVC